ncbi:hypothetical protein [Undibacterium sp. Ren11W]|uniref:hypothetical protein n=1 Tax=Undibacterium sp. Ren11W TaxID=3413045 RepID=UPI003BF04F93
MTQPSKAQSLNQKPEQTRPSKSDDVNAQKQKAEAKEVAGGHKNDGQKDHKGAR